MTSTDDARQTLDDTRRLLDAAGVASAVVDAEGTVCSASADFAVAFGAGPDELVGAHLLDLADDDDRAGLLSGLARLSDGSTPRVEVDLEHLRAADGGTVGGVLVVGRVGTTADPTAPLLAVLTVRDDRPSAAAVTLHPPGTDPLTGLGDATRRDDALAAAIARSRRTGTALAVLHCRPRDPEQPLRTDLPLREVGHRLVAALRETDLVCRVGDDLFVVAEHLGDEQDAAGVAYRLMSALVGPIEVGGEQVRIGLTIGIAVADGAAAPRTMLAAADDALDDARADGLGSFRIVDLRTGRAA